MTIKATYQELEQRVKILEKEVLRLKSNEQILRMMDDAVKSSLSAIAIADLQRKLVYVNNPCIEMWGYNHEEEVLGRSLSEFWDRDEAVDTMKELEEKGTASGEGIGKRKDGSLFNFQFSACIFKEESGHPAYIFGSFFDITVRKQAEQALRESEERFRVLVEDSPFGVSIISKDGHYTYLNPKFIEIFGYTLEDTSTGREWFRKAFPDRTYRHEVISTWIEEYKDSKAGEARLRTYTVTCKDGTRKVINFRPVTMESGDQFVIYEDITERPAMQASLQRT
jgi:PAS domain S-box-containing protein